MKQGKNLLKIIIIVFCFIILLFSSVAILRRKIITYNFQNEILAFYDNYSDKTFSIDKILMYNSCTADTKPVTNFTSWNLDISQYTDIAIYLNHSFDEPLTLKNTIKKLYINNISISETPLLGSANIYSKQIPDFGKFNYDKESIITDSFEYHVTDSKINYKSYDISYDKTTPITIGYLNKNIKSDYQIINTDNTLTFDGTLLKKANIPISSIRATISIDINIINNLDEHYICNLKIPITLQNTTTNSSIYNGNFLYELDNKKTYSFIKIH